MIEKSKQHTPHPGDNQVYFRGFYETILYFSILNKIPVPVITWLVFDSSLVYDMLLCE